MFDPQKKARDADRDSAIEVVEAAFADGQISRADYDLRVDRLLRAQTVGEVQSLVQDLRRSEEEDDEVTDVVEVVTEDTAPLIPPYGAAGTGSRAPVRVSMPPRLVPTLVIVGFVVAMVIGVGLPILLAVRSVDRDGVATGPLGFGEQVDLLTEDGYPVFTAALEEHTGSLEAFDLVVYPAYAVVEVPVDATSQRSFGYYYNGDFDEWTGKGTSTEERFEADQVDGAVIETLIGHVKGLIEEPTSWYAIIEAPGDGSTCLRTYASNDYNESAFVEARCDGTVLREYLS